jgi:hypothetical protein
VFTAVALTDLASSVNHVTDITSHENECKGHTHSMGEGTILEEYVASNAFVGEMESHSRHSVDNSTTIKEPTAVDEVLASNATYVSVNKSVCNVHDAVDSPTAEKPAGDAIESSSAEEYFDADQNFNYSYRSCCKKTNKIIIPVYISYFGGI